MQSIRITTQASRYIHEPHLVVTIDGQPLDERLAMSTTDDWLHGLISTWTGWLEEPSQQAIIDSRTLMFMGSPTILPILICPDDLDFSCTVVVTEVLHTPTQITWARFGFDSTPTRDVQPNTIGSSVDWFPDIESMKFDRDAYTSVLSNMLKTRQR
jgi:hypothetical protein